MAADLSQIFAALADPTRRAIVARLAKGDAPVKDLVEPFPLSGPAITKHLKVLERAGLITRSRVGQQRPCRLDLDAIAPAADWLDQYRALWDQRLDRLEALLLAETPGETATTEPALARNHSSSAAEGTSSRTRKVRATASARTKVDQPAARPRRRHPNSCT